MKTSLKIRCVLNIWKYPVFLLGLSLHEIVLDELKADAARILKRGCRKIDVFACLVSYRNYASIYDYRIKKSKTFKAFSRLFFKTNRNIELLCDSIGPGFLVLHNMGAVVRAKSIGKNCTISQGVTIGEGGSQNEKNDSDIPTIGDNVLIATNSVVVGRVFIGNDVIIGAGSIVTKSIDDKNVVVGNPAHVIKALE